MAREPKSTRVEQLEDGTWLYSDGAIRDEKGQLARQHPLSAPTITSENSPALLQRRYELRRQAVERGMATGDYETPTDAIEGMAAAQTILGSDPDAGASSTKAFYAVLRTSGYLPDRQEAGAAGGGNTYVLNITTDAAERLGLDVIDVEPYDSSQAASE